MACNAAELGGLGRPKLMVGCQSILVMLHLKLALVQEAGPI